MRLPIDPIAETSSSWPERSSRSGRLAVLFPLLLAACASAPTAPLRPAPALGDDVVNCETLYSGRAVKNGPAGAPPVGVLQGWVALAYTLKGDGMASDVRVIDSEPKGEFVDGAAYGVTRMRFKEGEVHDNCVSVFTIYRRPG
jgi:hypothetical protein